MPGTLKDRLIRKFENDIQALDRELKLELPKEIRRARELGDLRENAEYSAAKERQRLVEARMGLLKKRVAEIAAKHGVEAPVIGSTIANGLEIRQRGVTLGSWEIEPLLAAYTGALSANRQARRVRTVRMRRVIVPSISPKPIRFRPACHRGRATEPWLCVSFPQPP